MKGIYKFNNITLNNLKKFSTKNSNIKIESLTSSKTPEAIGPYSKATKVDICNQNLLFCSGSLGVDYKTGELISENVKEQTIQSLENLKNLLE